MAQDIRELFKQDQSPGSEKLSEGHSNRFKQRLAQDLPQEGPTNLNWLYKMAAVFFVAIGIVAFFFFSEIPDSGEGIVNGTTEQEKSIQVSSGEEQKSQVTLADISPEYKRVEEYYLANLNLGLSKLNITEENKALIDTFMAQLAELDKEYGRLNRELREHGFNGETVEALIQNLQFRLDLLYKLNSKLNELKQDRNGKYNRIQA